jgi:hypothetical protein
VGCPQILTSHVVTARSRSGVSKGQHPDPPHAAVYLFYRLSSPQKVHKKSQNPKKFNGPPHFSPRSYVPAAVVGSTREVVTSPLTQRRLPRETDWQACHPPPACGSAGRMSHVEAHSRDKEFPFFRRRGVAPSPGWLRPGRIRRRIFLPANQLGQQAGLTSVGVDKTKLRRAAGTGVV